jgi:maltoporin
MVGFQAPGASAKYRLGNEPDTYGENHLWQEFYGEGCVQGSMMRGEIKAGSGPIGGFQTTLAAYTPILDAISSGSAKLQLRRDLGFGGQRYFLAAIAEVLGGNRTTGGTTSYQRFLLFQHERHGRGFEDLKLGNGKLALAWIGTPGSSGVSSAPQPDASNKAGLQQDQL